MNVITGIRPSLILNTQNKQNHYALRINSLNADTVSFGNSQNRDVVTLDYTKMPAGTRLPYGTPVKLIGRESLRLANCRQSLDLSKQDIQLRLNSLKIGETITVGRNADIQFAEENSTVSRKHLSITREADGFYYTDHSTNGTVIARKDPRIHSSYAMKDLDRRHEVFSKSFFSDFQYDSHLSDTWIQFMRTETETHGCWKMHVFADTEEDYQKLCKAIVPYLQKEGITHKTLNAYVTLENLEEVAPQQRGKAFTLYPVNAKHFEKIARELSSIIKENGLERKNTTIVGDKVFPDTGRIGYRYEYSSKAYANRKYSYNFYESNRKNAQNAHLASDMTPEDDPWFDFIPTDKNSRPNLNGVGLIGYTIEE